MRIAIIRKKYTFHGGAEAFSQNLVLRLAQEGHEIHIYASKWEGGAPEKVFFHKVKGFPLTSFLRDLTFIFFSYRMVARDRESLDIIQTHDKTLYQDIYLAGDGCHIEWLRQRFRRTSLLKRISTALNPYHWLILIVERLIFRGHRFKKIIAISDMVKQDIITNYGVDEGDIRVIYHGIDTKKFSPDNRALYRADVRKEYNIGNDEFTILFVGSGFERKGLKYLIEAVDLLPSKATILVVGKGSSSYSRFSKKQRVIFCGPQKDTFRFYAAADAFALPAMYEPFGLVYLEALASGLPVITTKNSGAAEIIAEGVQGYVVDQPEDISEIARKIGLLAEKDRLEKMGRNARELAEKFTFERYTDEIMRFYAEMMEEKNNLSQKIEPDK